MHLIHWINLRNSLNLLSSVPLGIPRSIFIIDLPDVLQILWRLLILAIQHRQFLNPAIVIARVRRLPFLALRGLLHFHDLLLRRMQVLRLQFGSWLRLPVQSTWLNLLLGTAIKNILTLLEFGFDMRIVVRCRHSALLKLSKPEVSGTYIVVVDVLMRLAVNLVIPKAFERFLVDVVRVMHCYHFPI